MLVLDLEGVVEYDVAVNSLDNVVLHEDQPIDLDVDRKPVRIETSTYLLVDLDENVVRWLLD